VPAATNPEPKSEFDIEMEAIARAMHGRHPANRRCGETIIKRQLKTIAEKHPRSERLEVIRAIDKRHAGWCASDAWTKDGGEYAKGLENWLAPTMQRYMDEPPAPKPQPVRLMFGKAKSTNGGMDHFPGRSPAII
jgi:hypothetical protein